MSTEPLDVRRLTQAASTWSWLGVPEVVDEIPSTHRALVERADALEDGTIRLAEHQTEGRGRRGTRWHAAPRTGLLVSLVARPRLALDLWPARGLLLAEALAKGLEAATGLHARIKWPNDLLVDGRKIAGVLGEVTGGAAPAVVLSFGLNVHRRALPRAATEGLEWPATTVEDELGHSVDRTALLADLLGAIDAARGELAASPVDPERIAPHLWRRGEPVIVTAAGGEEVRGTLVGVDRAGALRLRGRAEAIHQGRLRAE